MSGLLSLLGLAGKLLDWGLSLLGLGEKSVVREAYNEVEEAKREQAQTEEELARVRSKAQAEKQRNEDIENIDEFFKEEDV